MALNFDAVTYFREMTENVIDFYNSDGENHFTQVSSMEQLEGFLAEMQYLKGYQLVYMDRLRARVVDNKSDNFVTQRFITFFVLVNVPDLTFAGKDLAVAATKIVCDKVIARMLYDRRNYTGNMHLMEPGSITIEQVGPIGTNWYGINCSFFMNDYPLNITYNENNYSA